MRRQIKKLDRRKTVLELVLVARARSRGSCMKTERDTWSCRVSGRQVWNWTRRMFACCLAVFHDSKQRFLLVPVNNLARHDCCLVLSAHRTPHTNDLWMCGLITAGVIQSASRLKPADASNIDQHRAMTTYLALVALAQREDTATE